MPHHPQHSSPRATPGRIAVAVFAASAAVAGLLIWRLEAQRVGGEREQLAQLAAYYANSLQRRLDRSLSATHALASMVRHGRGEVPGFESLAQELLLAYPGVAALGLAPGGVVRAIVPLAGNEGAIGHDMLQDPARAREDALARDTGRLTLEGPFALRQGGVGAVARQPVFLEVARGAPVFWGFTTALIRFPDALESSPLAELADRGVGYTLWRADPDTGERQVIAASGSFTPGAAVDRVVKVPNGAWTLSLSRLAGWGDPVGLSIKIALGVLFSLLAAGLARSLAATKAHEAQLGAIVAVRTEEIRESRSRLQLLEDNLPDSYVYQYRHDPDGTRRFLYLSAGVERLHGLQRGDVLRDAGTLHRTIDPEQLPAFTAAEAASLREMHDFRMELRMQRADGVWRWFQLRARPRIAGGGPALWDGVATDVTDRKEAEEEIRRLNAELEERVRDRTARLEAVNQELETFSYSVSHDLKAPLRGIDGYSRLLEEDHRAQLDDEGRLFVANIRKATAQMTQLIEDLLTYSRLERRPMQPTSLDLAALVREVVAQLGAEPGRVPLELRVEVPALRVSADRDGLAVVLRNLLENAVKFSRDAQPPAVEIGGRAEGARVVLWVRDNGIGFDMRFHDRIFEIFQRLQRSEDYPGTGIGLALVRKAMERMGGRAWAASAPGQGAAFFLEIPT